MYGLNLSKKEYGALEGLISTIETLKGCPVQCLTCGADSGKLEGYMSEDNFMRISEGFKQARIEDGTYVFRSFGHDEGGHPVIYSFSDAEPAYSKILPLFIEEIKESHGLGTYISTSGWRPSSTRLQRNMDWIVNYVSNF